MFSPQYPTSATREQDIISDSKFHLTKYHGDSSTIDGYIANQYRSNDGDLRINAQVQMNLRRNDFGAVDADTVLKFVGYAPISMAVVLARPIRGRQRRSGSRQH